MPFDIPVVFIQETHSSVSDVKTARELSELKTAREHSFLNYRGDSRDKPKLQKDSRGLKTA